MAILDRLCAAAGAVFLVSGLCLAAVDSARRDPANHASVHVRLVPDSTFSGRSFCTEMPHLCRFLMVRF